MDITDFEEIANYVFRLLLYELGYFIIVFETYISQANSYAHIICWWRLIIKAHQCNQNIYYHLRVTKQLTNLYTIQTETMNNT